MNYLNREQAPFDKAMWKQIDQEATQSAKELLTGRRFLDVEGTVRHWFHQLGSRLR